MHLVLCPNSSSRNYLATNNCWYVSWKDLFSNYPSIILPLGMFGSFRLLFPWIIFDPKQTVETTRKWNIRAA